MATLHFANAITSCQSSFLVGQASSAEESTESNKESTPDEQETTLASRDRLQDLPEWSEEFTETRLNQNQHLLAVTAEILQNHFVQILCQPKHRRGSTICHAFSQRSKVESCKSSLQTKFTKSPTPRDQVRRDHHSRSQSPQ